MLIDITDTVQLTHTAAEVDADIDGSVRGDIPQLKDDTWKEQARENIGAGSGSGGGRNLLDNGWFTVNQRGQNSYSSGYTLDRWLIGGGTFTVTKLNGYGINISKPANNSLLYMQTFESARFEVGKTYTVSINVDGVVYSKSFVYDGGSAQSYHNYVDFNGGGFRYRILQSGTNADLLEFRINDATTAALNVNIYSVMIEPSSASTLENDAPPDYTTELLKCMRYFERIYGNAGDALGCGQTRGNSLKITVPIRPKRTDALTVTFNGGAYFVALSDAYVQPTITSMSGAYHHANNSYMTLVMSTSSAFTAYRVCSVEFNGNNQYIDISADL